jgi:hypothetical protein
LVQRDGGFGGCPLVQDSEVVRLLAMILLVLYIPITSMIVGVLDGVDEELDRLAASGGRTLLSRLYLAGRENYARFCDSLRKAFRGVAE